MLPKDAKKDQGTTSHKVLHIKCTSFTSKKTKMAGFRYYKKSN